MTTKQTVSDVEFLAHCRSWDIYINPKGTSSTSIAGKMVTEAEQNKIAKKLSKLELFSCYKIDKRTKYSLTDKGRAASRGDEQTLTLEQARELHDNLLECKWGDLLIAKLVLAGRGKAAQQLRLVLARVYTKDGMSTFSNWHVVPCLTESGTIGVLDIAKGTAWETGVEADPGVFDLGLVSEVYAAANGISGDCSIDNQLVQRDGTAIIDGKIIIPKMPVGWKQIALPTWRGYDPEADHYTSVPEAMFRPEHWIRPTLVSTGLMTCYGYAGNPEDGQFLTRAYGWEGSFPWGVPEWIDGKSVTLLDTIADEVMFSGLQRTRVARGTDEEELQFLEAMYRVIIEELAPRYQQKCKEFKTRKIKHYNATTVRKGLAECAEALAYGRLPPISADSALVAIGNETNGGALVGLGSMMGLRQCEKAIAERLPYSAAIALARVGNML